MILSTAEAWLTLVAFAAILAGILLAYNFT